MRGDSSVVFYKPVGRYNQHPAYTDLLSGDAHIADILERLRRGPQWSRMLVIVTYDENGGFWDHRAAAGGSGLGRSLGSSDAHSGADHLPIRQARIHRQHRL